jgi:hypothetical protein
LIWIKKWCGISVVRDVKQADVSSTDQGAGKRREVIPDPCEGPELRRIALNKHPIECPLSEVKMG